MFGLRPLGGCVAAGCVGATEAIFIASGVGCGVALMIDREFGVVLVGEEAAASQHAAFAVGEIIDGIGGGRITRSVGMITILHPFPDVSE